MQKIFDVTQPGGTWLCNEDKKFYCKQIETNGRVGYTTLKAASLPTIHPSKRPRIEKSTLSATKVQKDSNLQIDCNSDASVDGSSYCESSSSDSQSQMKRSSTIPATQMVIRRSLSTGIAAKVCTDLAEQGVAIPTPTQSGVWRSVIRSGEKEKEHIKKFCRLKKTSAFILMEKSCVALNIK